MKPTNQTQTQKRPSGSPPDKVKEALDRGAVLKTLQSIHKFSATDNAFSVFNNLESSNTDQAYAKYSTNGKTVLNAKGYSLAFKCFLLGVDFGQLQLIKSDGSRSRLDAINKFINTTTLEIKVGDDPIRNCMLSDVIDPLPLIVNPLLYNGAIPANVYASPAVVASPASSIENDRNILRLPQDVIETKISFDFKLMKGTVGAELADHIFVTKWALEEESKRRVS